MGQTTITVSDETLSRFKRLKSDLNEGRDSPDHTNQTFLNALMDTWEAADDGHHSDPTAEEIAEELKNALSMANEPGPELDIERILGRIDDLEARIPKKVSEELQQ